MRADEIEQYTSDTNILNMKDFREMPEPEKEESSEYLAAQVTLTEAIHNVLRAAQWAKMYRGVRLDSAEWYELYSQLNDLKK